MKTTTTGEEKHTQHHIADPSLFCVFSFLFSLPSFFLFLHLFSLLASFFFFFIAIKRMCGRFVYQPICSKTSPSKRIFFVIFHRFFLHLWPHSLSAKEKKTCFHSLFLIESESDLIPCVDETLLVTAFIYAHVYCSV